MENLKKYNYQFYIINYQLIVGGVFMLNRILLLFGNEMDKNNLLKTGKHLQDKYGTEVYGLYIRDIRKYEVLPPTVEGLVVDNSANFLIREWEKSESLQVEELKKVFNEYFPVENLLVEEGITQEIIQEKLLGFDLIVIEKGKSITANQKELIKHDIDIYALIQSYADRAKWIITAGTCATFGGVFKQNEPESISGFCFDIEEKRNNYKKYAHKLISLPGCPIHPKWLSFVLLMLAKDKKIPIDEFHRPQELYGITVHTGCSRSEYFEWKIDTKGFGFKEGCLFYENGCQAPFTKGSCNKILWNDVSSKTIVGTPCFGCTEPDFPKNTLFTTKTNMGIPAKMPLGIPMRAYLTATGIAKSFKIKRLEERVIEYDSKKTN
jgi:hydrogenase small subunit